MRLNRRIRDVLIVVLLLALPFFVLRAHIREPGETSWLDRGILRVTSPFQEGIGAVARGITGFFGGYVALVDAERENDELRHENARLAARALALESESAENRRLRRLLGLRDTLPPPTVSAVVTAKDFTAAFRVARLTLDTGGAEVKADMPVVTPDGAVGTVQRVVGDTADVLLTVDAGFGVDVVAERTGARGFVRGTGDSAAYRVRVEYVRREDLLEEGDLLVTSGVGCRFPAGIPVARVLKLTKRDFGVYQEVEAEPTVDFSRLQEVLVVASTPVGCTAAASAK